MCVHAYTCRSAISRKNFVMRAIFVKWNGLRKRNRIFGVLVKYVDRFGEIFVANIYVKGLKAMMD